MMIQRKWQTCAGRDFFNVVVGVGCGSAASADCAAGFKSALAAISQAGFEGHQIVRSRIWARNASLRRIASDARLIALVDERRAASASFIAPERMSDGIDVLIDLEAIASSQSKEIREYEPRIAPPMFVALDGFVFLSGNTDVAPDFDSQLDHISVKIADSLAAASVKTQDIVRVDAYVSNQVDPRRALSGIVARFGGLVSMTDVSGFSAPEKTVEIEVTTKRP